MAWKIFHFILSTELRWRRVELDGFDGEDITVSGEQLYLHVPRESVHPSGGPGDRRRYRTRTERYENRTDLRSQDGTSGRDRPGGENIIFGIVNCLFSHSAGTFRAITFAILSFLNDCSGN